MTTWSLIAGLFLGACLLRAGVVAADVPRTITFTARITDGSAALDGPHDLTFRLFDAHTAGSQRWSENHTNLEVDDGLVTTALGSQAPLTPDVFDGTPLWVEVVLDGDIMTPRLPLRSVPYAVHTGDADLLGGLAATAFAAASHSHDPAYVNASGDSMSGGLNINADLLLGNKSALRGSDTWLRLNQDAAFTSGIHSPTNLNVSGLTVGPLYVNPGAGNLEVTGSTYLHGGGRFNGIAIGSASFGALSYPYETLQLDPGSNLRFNFGTTERMVLANNGRLWMSSNAGDCPAGWFCNGMFWDMSVASVLYSGLAQRSDARLKKDIETIEDGLAMVRSLRPVTFTWRDPAITGRQHGFIAQEVAKVEPDLVSQTADGMLALDTPEILPILLAAVKQLDAQNVQLRAEVDALRSGRPLPPVASSARAASSGGGSRSSGWPVRLGIGVAIAMALWSLVSRRRR